jgi:hypothetical protein
VSSGLMYGADSRTALNKLAVSLVILVYGSRPRILRAINERRYP